MNEEDRSPKRNVWVDSQLCKIRSVVIIMILAASRNLISETPTNLVPAVAVIRGGWVFFVLTGCKTRAEGLISLNLNFWL